MASGFEICKALTDGFICEGGDPKTVERLSTTKILIDIAEDEFTFTPGISGNDDAVCLVKAGTYHLELFECSWIGYILLVPACLSYH